MSLEVVPYPNAVLTTPTEPSMCDVEQETIDEMQTLMYKRHGIGMAANQVGINKSFFIANFSDGFTVCYDPKILNHGIQKISKPEGCLSMLDGKGNIIYRPKKRWSVIDVGYFNVNCVLILKTFKRLDARIFQHEMDHLEGRMCH